MHLRSISMLPPFASCHDHGTADREADGSAAVQIRRSGAFRRWCSRRVNLEAY